VQVAGNHHRLQGARQAVSVGGAVSVRILFDEGFGDCFELIQGCRPFEAELIQPVLAHPGHQRRVGLGLDVGDAPDFSVDGGRVQGDAFGLFVVEEDIFVGVFFYVRGHILEDASFHQLLELDGGDDHRVGDFAAGDSQVELVGVAVAGHYPGEGDVNVEGVFDVFQGAVIFDGFAFGEQ